MSDPYLGEIQLFGFPFPPEGWAKCDGQLLQISENEALFSLIGKTYGGDGQTTFGVPDLRGRTSYHQGNGPGLTPATLGQKGGANIGIITEAQLPSHTHDYKIPCNNDTGSTGNPSNAYPAPSSEDEYSTTKSENANMAETITTSSGDGRSFGIQGPYLAVNFCICLVGAFPPRQ